MAADLDHPFVDYLHKTDVATIVDEMLGTLAAEKPTEPLSGIYKSIDSKIHSKAKRSARGVLGMDVRRQCEQRDCFTIANSLMELYSDNKLLDYLERELDESYPTSFLLAVRIAKSKLMMKLLPPHHCSILLPITSDAECVDRIKSSNSHSTGEDLLKQKWNELHWLYETIPTSSWSLIVLVDNDISLDAVKNYCSEVNLPTDSSIQNNRGALIIIDTRDYDSSHNESVSSLSSMIAVGLQHVSDIRLSVSEKKHITTISTTSTLNIHFSQLYYLLKPMLLDKSKKTIATISSRKFFSKLDPVTGMPVSGLSKHLSLLFSIEGKYIRNLLPPLQILPSSVVLSTSVFENVIIAVSVSDCPSLSKIALNGTHTRSCLFLEIMTQLAMSSPGKQIIKEVEMIYVSSGKELHQLCCSEVPKSILEKSFSFIENVVMSSSYHRQQVMKAGFQSSSSSEWCAYLGTVNCVHYLQLFNLLSKAMNWKETISVIDPTVDRLSVEETHSISTSPESTVGIFVWE